MLHALLLAFTLSSLWVGFPGLAAAKSSAPGSIRGSVALCLGELDGATVHVPSLYVARVDEAGAFVLSGIPAGTLYTVRIDVPGKPEHVVEGVAVAAGATTNLGAIPVCADRDEDGFAEDVDCNEASGEIHPGAPELGGTTCSDRLDNDCDGEIDECDTCEDLLIDGDESDLDCGGSCPGCLPGRDCASNSDCASGACNYATLECEPCQGEGEQLCAVGLTGEYTCTDVDSDPYHCGSCGSVCGAGSSCVAGACLASGSTRCSDEHVSGTETDVDCGGETCPPCSFDKKCLVDADCGSAVCDPGTHRCL
jgi:hypothetical protein